MIDPLAFWRAVLKPPFLHDPPPSVLFGVKDKLAATIAMLGTLNADAQNEKEFGAEVASMATKYAIAVLSHFEPLDNDGPPPVFLNLTMAQVALKNLLAVVESQIDILHGDEEADASQDARSTSDLALWDELVIDAEEFTVRYRGKPCKLGNTIKFRLLVCLAEARGKPVEHGALAKRSGETTSLNTAQSTSR